VSTATAASLPEIPLIETGPDWVFETLEREVARVHALLDAGAGRVPNAAIRAADAVSRGWLQRHRAPLLSEIERVSQIVGRPGAYFLNVSYEWGCSCRAAPSPDGRSARLLRALDWPDPGLGRYVIAVRVASPAGRWVTLTWPGYVGVLQAVAPGRFAAALNQAPLEGPTGVFAFDWLAERGQIWRRPHPPASHLLRRVFETAPDCQVARKMLTSSPIAAGAIFTLAGLAPDETYVIERRSDDAHVIEGPAVAVNEWRSPGWKGHARGEANSARHAIMAAARMEMGDSFPWLRPPVLNDRTRLAFVADASTGAFAAQGWEKGGPATAILRMAM
jgi:hypothetical protein